MGEKSKTQISAPDQDVEFLGLALTKAAALGKYELKITASQLGNIKSTLYDLGDLNALSKQGITFPVLAKTIENKVTGYQMAYSGASNVEELRGMTSSIAPVIMWRVLSSIFGEDAMKKLSDKECAFLGL